MLTKKYPNFCPRNSLMKAFDDVMKTIFSKNVKKCIFFPSINKYFATLIFNVFLTQTFSKAKHVRSALNFLFHVWRQHFTLQLVYSLLYWSRMKIQSKWLRYSHHFQNIAVQTHILYFLLLLCFTDLALHVEVGMGGSSSWL